jgi:hypothetical protein
MTTLTPEQHFHGPSQKMLKERRNWLAPIVYQGFYVILIGWDKQQHASFQFIVYPFHSLDLDRRIRLVPIGVLLAIIRRPGRDG